MLRFLVSYRYSVLLLFIVLFSVQPCFCLNLYISPRGDDANVGSAQKPLRSINGAVARIRKLKQSGIRENVVVNISSGIYMLTEPVIFGAADGGTGQQTITYRGTGIQKPIISGGKIIKGFRKESNGIWSLYLPEVKSSQWYFEDLYINGVRATRAKWPNDGYFESVQATERVLKKNADPVPESAVQTITISPQQAVLLNSVPPNQLQDVLLSFNHKWDNTRKRIQSYNPATRQITIAGRGMIPWNALDAKTIFTIENAKAALDAPGEWFLDRQSGYLYYYPRSTDNISAAIGCVPVLKQFLLIEATAGAKVQNLRFENLSFQYTSFTVPPEGVEPVQATATLEATIMVDFSDKVVFRDCEIAHTGVYAIWFRKDCRSDSVLHSRLWDLGAGGIKLGEIDHNPAVPNSTALVVDNNILQQGGQVFPSGVPVSLYTASDCHVTHNDIGNFKYCGIIVGWWVQGTPDGYAKRNDISFNHIHHLGWGVLSDMGGIYTLSNLEGTVLSNNRIHDIYAYDYGGWGIYNDESSANITIQNNLVYNCKSAAYHDHFGKRNTVTNNLFYNQVIAQLEANSGPASDRLTFTHNIVSFSRGKLTSPYWFMNKSVSDSNVYWDTRKKPLQFADKTFRQWQASGIDTHSIVEDPQLLAPQNENFTIGNQALIRKIGFTAFDYQAAGVYGSDSWKQAASLNTVTTIRFKSLYKNTAE